MNIDGREAAAAVLRYSNCYICDNVVWMTAVQLAVIVLIGRCIECRPLAVCIGSVILLLAGTRRRVFWYNCDVYRRSGGSSDVGVCSFLVLLSQMDQEHLGKFIWEQENIAWVYVTDWHWPFPRRGSAAWRSVCCECCVLCCVVLSGRAVLPQARLCDREAPILRTPGPIGGGGCFVLEKITGPQNVFYFFARYVKLWKLCGIFWSCDSDYLNLT
jgi:hypothetical protein